MHRTDLPYRIVLSFDGSCKPNPGGRSTYGWAITNEKGALLAKGSGIVNSDHGNDNNQAEWGALVMGLEHLNTIENWNGILTIVGDSQLVIKQIGNIWSCKSPKLQVYYKRAKEILLGRRWRAIWIHRSSNQYCDFLACLVQKEYEDDV